MFQNKLEEIQRIEVVIYLGLYSISHKLELYLLKYKYTYKNHRNDYGNTDNLSER